jgi:GPCR-chaperone
LHLDLNSSDLLGLTPLQLAIRLGNADACLVLIDAGADPTFRGSCWLRSPVEEAKREQVPEEKRTAHEHNNNISVEGKFINEQQKKKKKTHWDVGKIVEIGERRKRWEDQRRRAGKVLREIPDFKGEVRWECESRFLPFAKKLAPSDCYKIFKRDDRIRVDLTLKSWSGGKCVRGNNSVIFDGNYQKMWVVDHERQRVWEEEEGGGKKKEAEEPPSRLKREENFNVKAREEEEGEVTAEGLEFYKNLDWRGNEIREFVGKIETVKYGVRGKLVIKRERGEVWEGIDWGKWESFEEYCQWGMKNGLSKKLGLDERLSPVERIREYLGRENHSNYQ